MSTVDETRDTVASTNKSKGWVSGPLSGSGSILNRAMTIHNPSAYQNPSRSRHHQYNNTKPSSAMMVSPLDRSSSTATRQHRWFNPFESAGNSIKGKVKQLKTLFESQKQHQIIVPSALSETTNQPAVVPKLKHTKSFGAESILDASTIRLPGMEDRIVVYFTSLRGVRRTYEDCYAVRLILRGYKVYVDERDLSMDAGYKEELQRVLGVKNGSPVSLPVVFVKGKFLGGADMVRHLNEMGELRKLLEGLPRRERGCMCDSCGDVRFVPCFNCSGSRKVFDHDQGLMKRCPECNENGLVRCPECCL